MKPCRLTALTKIAREENGNRAIDLILTRLDAGGPLSLSSDRILFVQVLELAVFPSVAAKVPVLLSMVVSLVGPLLLDRLSVMLFDPELHRARKAEPPLGSVVRKRTASSQYFKAVLPIVGIYPRTFFSGRGAYYIRYGDDAVFLHLVASD